MTITLKQPIGIDLSHWRPVTDFAALNPRPYLIITKATEGLSYVDPTFIPHMQGIKAEGYHRGCFHFFRKAYDPIKQAQHFCNTIRPYVTDKDLLILDVEEGGETAAQLQKWLTETKRQYPNNKLLLYSNKVTLDPIPMTTVEKTFFRQIEIWAAGYPSNPDIYPVIPEGYKPTHDKYGPTIMWQYTDRGIINGVTPNTVDCNLLAPELISYLGASSPPPDPDTGENMIYVTQVTTAALNGRSTPGGPIIWQAGMKANDLLVCDEKQTFDGAVWFHVRTVLRNSLNVAMPAPVWASVGATNSLQKLISSFEVECESEPAKTIEEIVLDLATGSTVTTHYTDGTQKTETA